MRISFERQLQPDWSELDRFADRTLFQTRPWLDFVAEAHGAEVCVLKVWVESQPAGYFTGLIITKLGLKILGAPFPGWTTQYLGFNLIDGVDRSVLLEPLAKFAFGELNCWHLELMDRRLTAEQVLSLGWKHRLFENTEVDLSGTEDEIFANMKGSCRTSIRKAEKSGVVVEAASDDQFADEYYRQLTEVFARQNLRPTYGVERVRQLIKHLYPSGRLLLIRARNADGECLATGIYPAFNGTMYFWGGASLRQFQILQPNEAIQWFAMRYWKERGMTVCDMGGGGEYKTKYGGTPLILPWCRHSRCGWVGMARELAQRSHFAVRRVVGRSF
ncbi:MAG: GNAT family N-acetyltransferase [candidate division Zixibacteria bacterium]|nr:GNAT family N-acetyltransferase [candidate division Zixibacteria bacterium]